VKVHDFKKFDVLRCNACSEKFLNLNPNGVAALCPACGTSDVTLWKRPKDSRTNAPREP
jgi:rRNA maturation endonuclease Nob1